MDPYSNGYPGSGSALVMRIPDPDSADLNSSELGNGIERKKNSEKYIYKDLSFNQFIDSISRKPEKDNKKTEKNITKFFV